MTVRKAVELIGEGPTIEESVQEALDRAGMTLEGITSFEIQRVSGTVEGGRLSYRVELRVWFTLLERLHG
jgi:dodecin